MKKNTLFLAVLLFVSTLTFSQTYVMGTDTGTITTCSGTFVDSGGASGTYSSNEDATITFCPTTAGDLIQIDFSSFNTQGAAGACNDILEAWPGPDNTSTSYGQFCANLGTFTITSTSADGCITLQFTSDDTLTQAGWEAAITCITPCIAPVAALTDTSEVDLCSVDALNPGDVTLNFDASASTSPGAGTTLTTYDWSWGDGTSETTTTPTVSHTFPGTGGIYMVNLSVRNDNTDTDPLGCQSTNAVTKQINIFTAPSYAGTGGIETGSGNTAATTITIDCGDTVDLNGLVRSQTTTQPIPELDAGITQLPDGSGASYESSLDFTGLFPIGETITPGCYPTLNFTIEHSYTGDLDIDLIAPSGEVVRIFDQTGGGTHFGTCANAPDDGVPGCVALYSVVNSGGVDWTAGGVTTTATSNCATFTGTCETGNYFIAQTYNSNESFAAFDGADLNGVWSLRITDNLAIDDGVLESWSLDFDTSCYVDLESVTPDLDMNATSGVWQYTGAGPALPTQSPTSVTVTNPGPADCPAGQTCEGDEITNNVVVGPFETGGETHVYSFLVTDEFGCEYQQDVTINVADNCTQCSLDLNSAAGTDAQTLCENTPITDITYIAGNEVVDVTVTGLPAGVTGSYDATNSLFTITGTPTVTGVYNYSVSTVGCLDTVIVTLTGSITITEIPTAAISYAGTPFCTATTTGEAVTLTGTAAYTGGTYSSTAGLTIDTTTGEITPSTSTAGSYTVTYSIPASGGCPSEDVTTTVNVTEMPTATISYAGTPFCMSVSTSEAVTLSGTAAYTGGTYSSTAGLTIDTTTGAITPSTSTAGTYTVTYSMLASGGCPSEDATTTVTITEVPTAAISYAGTPFCTATTTGEAVTLTGTAAYTGGTYSSTAGLTIDTTTGAITPSTSTAGAYTITYSIPASAGCPSEDVTTTVDITEAPTATISYAGTPFCMSVSTSEAVTLSGTAAYTGGTYSSTAGLTIDATTGAIVPSTSTAGTYTVTYSMLASGGCPSEDVTTTVDITEVPTAAISYAGTPFCTATTTGEAVTLTGTAAYTGGTYSSTAGLTLDATTGAITPSTSTAGSYTVTYSIPASGGCPSEDVTTTVTITEAPTATISYAGTPFCMSVSTSETVSLSGTAAYTGGTYSSTAGLTIDATTGAIVPSTSTAGTYTVTYSMLASGGCPSEDATTTVTITEVPTAAISYAGTPFCTATTTGEAVTLTGTAAYTGGTYSSTAGLTIDATTGAITPSTSTAGSYTVTYSIPASAGCPSEDVTTTVDITEAPTAVISYAGTPFCMSISISEVVIITGTAAYTGGTYSATAGLTIDATTGAIVPSTSTAGTYTVTYSMLASGGCPSEDATTTVTITEVPTAAITYASSPFCTATTTGEAVTITGTAAYTGGTYSSTAGLTIDTTTGAIIPSASTAGTYTVTYSIPASGGCPSEDATTTVEITSESTAMISYDSSPYCISETALVGVTLTGTGSFTGGAYSSTTGLTLDVTTGAIAANTSTAGTYTVTYTVPAMGGCAAAPVTTSVVITEVPTAVINYTGAPFCTDSGAIEAVTLTGTAAYTGGTYSSIAGLIIDTATGDINLGASVAGMYTVTYTIPASGGCASEEATTIVNINNAPTATISYVGAPFCITDTAGSIVTLTGTDAYTGGTYSANAGLTIDATTGTITPNTSTAGSHTVTYTIPASAGCMAVAVTTIVNITEVPTAAIVYDGAPFCISIIGDEAVTLTGTDAYTGGTYSSTAGLTLDATTGTITPNTSIVGAYVVTYTTPSTGGCAAITTTTTITVNNAPSANVVTPLNTCDADNDGFALFDINNPTTLAEITGGSPLYVVTYHETLAEATAGVGAIDTSVLYPNINVYTQTVYVRVSLSATGCYAIVDLVLNVIDSPSLPSEALEYALCDDFNDLTDGLASFDLATYNALVLANIAAGTTAADYTVSYYTALDASGNPDPATLIANPSAFQNTSTPDQTIYVSVVQNDVYSCESIKEINLHVDLLPDAFYQAIDVCDDAVADGFYEFNLTDYTDLITGGATDVTLSYYTVAADAIAGAGASLIATPTAFTNTSNPQSIFVRVYRASTGCFAVTPFTLHVDPNPTPLSTADIATNLGVLMACDGNVDGAGDIAEQIAEFDLTTWETQILTGTGPGVEVGVSASYYTDASEAATATNPIATPTTFSNTSNPQTIYVRVTNDGTGITPVTSGTGCYQVVSFQIYVPMPWVTVSGDTILCVDSSGVPLAGQPLPVITAVGGPDASASYSYQWALNGVAIAGATSETLTAVLPGDYTVTIAGPTDLSCVNTATHTITVSGMPDDYTATISTNAFADFHQIVATATSSSTDIEFLFSLDGGAFQNTGVFNDVNPGLHYVTIKDTEGCWEDTLTVLVVDYPHFFTPNNDGYNDTWQVTGSSDVVILGIVIYNRQGKALQRLAPGDSWDGRYNGTLMPSNDYWFVITYTEGATDPVQKEFRAHFALKL